MPVRATWNKHWVLGLLVPKVALEDVSGLGPSAGLSQRGLGPHGVSGP